MPKPSTVYQVSDEKIALSDAESLNALKEILLKSCLFKCNDCLAFKLS